MTLKESLQGNWNEIRGKVKERWARLTDDELDRVEANADQLVGLIQQKTGETRDAVERQLDEIVERGTSTAQRAGERIKDAAHSVGDSVQRSYHGTEELVKAHPASAAIVAFATGTLVGVAVGLALGHRD